MTEPYEDRERAAAFVFILTAGGFLGGLLHWLGLALWQIPIVLVVNAVSVVLVLALVRRWIWNRGMDQFRELHPEMFTDDRREPPPLI